MAEDRRAPVVQLAAKRLVPVPKGWLRFCVASLQKDQLGAVPTSLQTSSR